MGTREQGEALVEQVKERYGRIAQGLESGCCAGSCGSPEAARAIGYSPQELKVAPPEANLGLGCGAPIDHLDLRLGETVLDLGSGAGLDAFLAARRVGSEGRVIGVDMTPAMLERARAAAARMGLSQVEFREGRLEALPVEDASIDAVTSNCVINLVPDKAAVFREAARVLRPGGRLVVSDILLDGRLPEALEKDVLAYVGCVSGAMPRGEYFAAVEKAGLSCVEILKEVDYVAVLAGAAPDEASSLLGRYGLREEDLRGKVRSVTFRAMKA